MQVFELPPNESLNKKVNLESLYGICLYFPYATSSRLLITNPSVVKDLLIFEASFNLSPTVLDIFYLSEPAKSTKFSLELLTIYKPSFSILLSIISYRIV